MADAVDWLNAHKNKQLRLFILGHGDCSDPSKPFWDGVSDAPVGNVQDLVTSVAQGRSESCALCLVLCCSSSFTSCTGAERVAVEGMYFANVPAEGAITQINLYGAAPHAAGAGAGAGARAGAGVGAGTGSGGTGSGGTGRDGKVAPVLAKPAATIQKHVNVVVGKVTFVCYYSELKRKLNRGVRVWGNLPVSKGFDERFMVRPNPHSVRKYNKNRDRFYRDLALALFSEGADGNVCIASVDDEVTVFDTVFTLVYCPA